MSNGTTTGFASIPGGKLYYEMAGEGDTVVFSHAGFVDSGMWDAQFALFAEQYRVIRYDMRGFGRSDPAAGPGSRRDDLVALLDVLGVTRAAFIGCSMSAGAILDFSLARPELVAKQVLITGVPGGMPFDGEELPAEVEMFEAMERGDVERASELQLQLWVDGASRQPHEVDPRVRSHAAAMTRVPTARRTMLVADSSRVNPLDPPAFNRLAEVRAPTLVVTGALDEPLIVEAARVMAEGIPGARLLVIDDAAHVPSMERPEVFNPEALAFLAA